ncbi:MAG: hypothetical protein IMZ57_05065 [Acidobacteria bacterium]|nr:hypothetical protein [Acidobacteriota bacterium]
MQKRILRVFLAIIFVVLTASSCRSGIKSSDTEAWKGLYRVEVKELLRIGSEDLANDPCMFTGINDLRIDAADNVYALDRREMVIKVFSPTGQYLKAYQLKKGQGPGEFERPLGFAIGPNGDLIIADMTSRRIVKIDQAGNCVDTMTIKTYPGSIAVDRGGSLYMTGGLVDTSEYEVQKYHFPDGKLLASFCPTNELAEWIGRVGGNGEMCLNPRGNILYSFCIPYDIREFTPKGELIHRFGRNLPGWKPPRISYEGLPDSPVMTLDIDTFPDGKIFHVMLDRRAKPYTYCFDVFDEHGTWLISFDTREYIKDKNGRMARIDGQGNVYMEFWEPFPHIRKYSIEFVPIKGKQQN